MAYATVNDLACRYDQRTIADLASDDGTPVADLSTNARVLAALDDASGQVDAAVLVGRIYEPSDLSGLTGTAAALLKRLVCDLAMGYLLAARPEKYGSEAVEKAYQRAEQYLDRLRKGERLFPTEEAPDAGLPTIDGPTVTTYERLNLLPERTQHYYPGRAGRLPAGRG